MVKDNPRFTLLDGICLLALAAFWFLVAANHELGHDEAQAWNIARDSQAWWDVVWTSRYEGHTPVWFALLWPFTLSGNPLFMQMLAVSLGVVVAYLLLRYRPIPRWLCLMLLCGYFFGYEYTVVPRPYIVATLLSVWLAIVLQQNRYGFVGRALICGLLASTSAFGVVLSAALMVLVMLEELLSGKRPPLRITGWLVGLLIYGALALAAVYFVIFPIEDRVYETAVLSGERISKISWWQTVRSAVFPHVDRLPMGIGRQMGTDTPLGLLVIAGSMVVAFCVAIWVSEKPAALASWLVAVILLSLAAILAGSGAERHMGHLFLAAVVVIWARPGLASVSWCKRGMKGGSLSPGRSSRLPRHAAAAVLVLAVTYQTLSGLGAAGMDVSRSLTQWPVISEKVKAVSEGGTAVMTDKVYHAGALTALLDKPVFDLRCQCWTRHELWQGSAIPEDLSAYNDMLIARSCDMLQSHDEVLFMRVMQEWPDDAPFALIEEFSSGYRDGRYAAPRLYRFIGASELCESQGGNVADAGHASHDALSDTVTE